MQFKKDRIGSLIKKAFVVPVPSHVSLLGIGLIVLFAVPLVYAAFHGVRTPDESFYLSIPYRLCRGDALLIDEWHAEQLSAFLQYLPIRLFLRITGGTEGIMLFSRLLFCICQTAMAVFIFLKLKKLGFISALGSAILFELYVPELVEALDYYTMSLMGYEIIALMLFLTEKHTPLKSVFTGIVVACTVVAQPFNCIAYFIFSVFVAVLFLKQKRRGTPVPEILSLRHWVWITSGVVLVAAVFFVWLFSQASPELLLKNVGNLFGGEDHILPFTPGKQSDMFRYHVILQTLFSVSPVMFCGSLALTVLIFFAKNKGARTKALLAVCLGLFSLLYTGAAVVRMFSSPVILLFSPYIPAFFGINCYLLTVKKDRRLLKVWCAGVIYVLCLGIISQALDYIGVIGLVVSNTAVVPMAVDLFRELRSGLMKEKEKKTAKKQPAHTLLRTAKPVFAVSAAVVFSVWIGTFAVAHFWNDPAQAMLNGSPSADYERIDIGPFRGISVPKEKKDEYNSILFDLLQIKENGAEQPKILIADLLPWGYFCFEKSPAAFTTWFIENELYMYEPYYETSSHVPDVIYIPYRNFYFGNNGIVNTDTVLDFFQTLFPGEITERKGGFVLYCRHE